MDPAYRDKKIVDLSDAELIALGFLGENVDPEVDETVRKTRAMPQYMSWVTCFMVDCLRSSNAAKAHDPFAAAERAADALFAALLADPAAHTPAAPALVSALEARFYYHGLCAGLPPPLLWRTSRARAPFAVPPPGTHRGALPARGAHAVVGTRLNAAWDALAPRVLAALRARGVRWTSLKAARFEGGGAPRGPPVLWIAVAPGTAAQAVCDATPDVLRILADEQITDVDVEWYEAEVRRLVG